MWIVRLSISFSIVPRGEIIFRFWYDIFIEKGLEIFPTDQRNNLGQNKQEIKTALLFN